MNPTLTCRIATVLLPLSTLISQPSTVCTQGSAFTYQGRLSDSGSPASGSYDFRFQLASDALGNDLVAGPLVSNTVPVVSGLFSVTLDYGAGVFTGSNYWLQVDVKTNGAGGYTTLMPLQSLRRTPYAIMAANAASAEALSGTVAASQLIGTISANNIRTGSLLADAGQWCGGIRPTGGGCGHLRSAGRRVDHRRESGQRFQLVRANHYQSQSRSQR